MRPQQQGRRQRSRGSSNNSNNNNNNNNRGRNQNPLARSYESNGPDVKIRGNAQQIADKYETLASDAQSSGDRVVAENYLQHAEHYKRIIMAAQTQAREEQEQRDRQAAERQANEPAQEANRTEDDNDDEGSEQPEIKGTPAEVAHRDDQQAAPAKPRRRRPTADAPAATAENGDNQQAEAADADGQKKPAPRKRKRPVKKDEAEASTDDGADNQASSGDETPDAAPAVTA